MVHARTNYEHMAHARTNLLVPNSLITSPYPSISIINLSVYKILKDYVYALQLCTVCTQCNCAPHVCTVVVHRMYAL